MLTPLPGQAGVHHHATQTSLLQRSLLTILFLAILGIPAFAWVQYRQSQSLERLTAQNFSGYEWDAFKLELRVMHLRSALREAAAHPEDSKLLAQASTEHNLLAGQVLLMNKGSTTEAIDDLERYRVAMAQAAAYLKQADPVLADVPKPSDREALQAFAVQVDQLQADIHRLVIEVHDLRSLRASELIEEVQRVNLYFATLSAVVVILAAGWGLSAMRNLRLAVGRQRDLNALVEESSFRASHDFLTGLANRSLLYEQLKHAISSGKRDGSCGAVILIDLDNFKPLNDRHGHDAGDLLLIEVAHRIKKCVREVDTVARVGGDEFVVLMAQMGDEPKDAADAVTTIAQKLLLAVSAPYFLSPAGGDPVTHVCAASMGACIFCKDSLDMNDILKCADAAMYRAKQAGGNRVEVAA